MGFLPQITMPQFETETSDWDDISIEDFSGGLRTASPESKIRDNQFTVLSNYYIESNSSLKTRGPFRPWLVASEDTVLATAPLTFAIEKLNGTTYRIASRDAGSTYQVEYYDESGDTWTAVKTGLTDSYQVEFTKFSVNDRDDLIICNGQDTPQRWPGSGTSTDLGLTKPSAAVITAAAAADGGTGATGVGTTGTYYYKLTYFYDSTTTTQYGESNPSATTFNVAMTISAGDYHAIDISSLPTFPTGVTRIYIYRSQVDTENGIYRQVGYITSGTTFTDNTNEGEEGVALPVEDGSVPNFKHPYFFEGRIWAVDGSLTNKLIYSSKGNCDLFPALNYAYLPRDIKGIRAFNEDLYIFTTEQIYVVPKADIETYPEPLKVADKGCTCFASVIDVGNGLVWQGEDCVYWADFNMQSFKDGDFPIPIGEPIEDKIQDIPILQRVKSTACLYNNRYYISFVGPGQTINSRTLVWDVRKGADLIKQGLMGAWTSLDWSANWLVNSDGTLYSADNTNKYIMEHDWAGVVDYLNKTNYDATTSSNITTELKTKRLHFQNEWAEKIIRSLSLVAETSGISYNATLSLNYRDHERTQTFTLGSGTPTYATDWLIWGQGNWGSFNWGASTYQIYSDHKGFGAGAKGRNAQLTISSNNSKDTNLTFLKLYYKTLPRVA
jgi:hypothetical protein